jgi:purine-cytosine permease-like protein
MRWKLLLIASLLATLVGAGATLGIVIGVLGTPGQFTAPDLAVLGTLIVPVAAITFASIFVYRHTARRRKLQAMATALLAIILTLTLLIASSVLFSKPAPAEAPPAPRRNG